MGLGRGYHQPRKGVKEMRRGDAWHGALGEFSVNHAKYAKQRVLHSIGDAAARRPCRERNKTKMGQRESRPREKTASERRIITPLDIPLSAIRLAA
jgi:hypothetical protein